MLSEKNLESLFKYLKKCGANKYDLDYTFKKLYNGKFLSIKKYNKLCEDIQVTNAIRFKNVGGYITYSELRQFLSMELSELPLYINDVEDEEPVKHVIRWRLAIGV